MNVQIDKLEKMLNKTHLEVVPSSNKSRYTQIRCSLRVLWIIKDSLKVENIGLSYARKNSHLFGCLGIPKDTSHDPLLPQPLFKKQQQSCWERNRFSLFKTSTVLLTFMNPNNYQFIIIFVKLFLQTSRHFWNDADSVSAYRLLKEEMDTKLSNYIIHVITTFSYLADKV